MIRLKRSSGIGVPFKRAPRKLHNGTKQCVHRGGATDRLYLSGEGDRNAPEVDAVGEVAATVVALLSGGGTCRLGVTAGDVSVEAENVVFLLRLRDADRTCSNPRPRVGLELGEFKAVDDGEPRRTMLPGIIGRFDLRSGDELAAIPSQAISSIGCTTRTMSADPNNAMLFAMMACRSSIIEDTTSAAVAGLMGAKGCT